MFVYKNGNLIADAEGRSFVFNGENKQAKIIKDNKLVGEYDYNGEGKRVRKQTFDTSGYLQDTTVFVYSAGKLVAEYTTAPRIRNSEFGFWIAANPSPSESLDRPSKIGNPKSKTERHPGQRHRPA